MRGLALASLLLGCARQSSSDDLFPLLLPRAKPQAPEVPLESLTVRDGKDGARAPEAPDSAVMAATLALLRDGRAKPLTQAQRADTIAVVAAFSLVSSAARADSVDSEFIMEVVGYLIYGRPSGQPRLGRFVSELRTERRVYVAYRSVDAWQVAANQSRPFKFPVAILAESASFALSSNDQDAIRRLVRTDR